MVRPVDLAKLKKLLGVFKKVPSLSCIDAMKLAKYSDVEISNHVFRGFLRRCLPSGSLNGFRGILAGDAPPPNCSKRRQKRAINGDIERTTPPVERTPPPPLAPNHHKMMLSLTIAPPYSSLDNVCDDGKILMPEDTTKKHKQWIRGYYQQKKTAKTVNRTMTTTTTTTTGPNATTMTTTTMAAMTANNITTTTMTTVMNATTMVVADDWLCRVENSVMELCCKKIAKMRCVKPAVDRIPNASSVEEMASILCAVLDHRDLAAALEFIGIDSTKEMSAVKYLCEQSARMLICARKNSKAQGK
jgi:hypothetical protein